MKNAYRIILLLVVSCLVVTASVTWEHQAANVPQLGPCNKGTPYRNCEACGSAKSVAGRELDILKNRDDKATNPTKITVAEMRNSNADTFSPNKQVWVQAFVASVVSGGDKESCNCGRADLRDVHINIIASPSELHDLSKYVIVEFTPRWEKNFGFDDSNYKAMLAKVKGQIEGKWVAFGGWMLYDKFHEDQSKSAKPNLPTCPDDGKNHSGCNWRATPWEVHPVTEYKVCQSATKCD